MSEDCQIEKLTEWIQDTYGSSAQLCEHLNMAMEMLFYVEEDAFDRREIQNVVTALRGLGRVLG